MAKVSCASWPAGTSSGWWMYAWTLMPLLPPPGCSSMYWRSFETNSVRNAAYWSIHVAIALHMMVHNIHNSCHTTLNPKVNSMYSNFNVFLSLNFEELMMTEVVCIMKMREASFWGKWFYSLFSIWWDNGEEGQNSRHFPWVPPQGEAKIVVRFLAWKWTTTLT